eukprot:2121331-Pyramimonas_sp.AAC.1
MYPALLDSDGMVSVATNFSLLGLTLLVAAQLCVFCASLCRLKTTPAAFYSDSTLRMICLYPLDRTPLYSDLPRPFLTPKFDLCAAKVGTPVKQPEESIAMSEEAAGE